MSWVAVAVGVGGIAYGALSAPNGVKSTDPSERPLGVESILGQLSLETLYELGVPMQGIEEELLQRRISDVGGRPEQARKAMKMINRIRMYQANPEMMRRGPKHVEHLLREANKYARKAGVSIAIEGGDVKVRFSGPDEQMLQTLRQREVQAAETKANRLKAMDRLNNLLGQFAEDGDGRIPGEEAASKYLNTFLDDQFKTESENIANRANKLGISPGGQLGELQRALELERAKIHSGGALERALALANAEQGFLQKGLIPANAATTLQYSGQASQDFLGSQALAQQLAIADAEAKSARAAGFSNLGGSLVGLGSSILSSGALKDALSDDGSGQTSSSGGASGSGASGSGSGGGGGSGR